VSFIIPTGAAEKTAMNWQSWPIAMVPVAVIGLLLCTRVWNAKPQPKAASAH
jgi:OPA family glycerol-3-phosphate transporter-like MFS transporter